MRIRIYSLLMLLFIPMGYVCAQVPTSSSILGKEYSKEIALYKAKEFLIKNIIGPTDDIMQFDIDPLAASSSGELTSLVYNCRKMNIEGLLLGFFGNYWNEEGVMFQGYDFKNLPKENALELLNKIDKIIKDYGGLISMNESYNIYFSYNDMIILLYGYNSQLKIRFFWKDFDAEWENTAFKRTLKRFEKNIK